MKLMANIPFFTSRDIAENGEQGEELESGKQAWRATVPH